MNKIQIARYQLGTSLALFIENMDPISVHCLACSAGELIESISSHENIDVFTNKLIRQNPGLDIKEFRKIRSKYWNAFKHATSKNKNLLRNDESLLKGFSDKINDSILLLSWTDYSSYTKKLPIEAQVFQTWFYALNEEKLDPKVNKEPYRNIFPEIKNKTRIEQKLILKRACIAFKDAEINEEDENDIEIKTETDPLIYPCDL